MAIPAEIAQLIRQMQGAIKGLNDKVHDGLREAATSQKMMSQFLGLMKDSTLKPSTNFMRAVISAKDMRPGFIILRQTFAIGATAEDATSERSNTVGRFIVTRVRAYWLNTTTGVYGHISSSINPDMTSTNAIDFRWEPIDGRNDQSLTNYALPCDVFARNDRDGFITGGWVLEPGTDVKVKTAPLRALPSNGTIEYVFEGIQCYDQVGAP